MWTLGYDDNIGGEYCFSDQPFHGGRKLRSLVPRPLPSLRVNGANFSSQYYHLANLLNDQSKRELLNSDNSSSSSPVIVSSSRWNPTPEQLRILEELYRRGTRTPSADQIQHITAQLRRFGKIEGKNVFYWFQNHKARERQKRRRQTAAEQTKYSEAEKEYEIQQTKTNCSWPRPTLAPSKICLTTLSQECAKTQRRTKVVELEEEEEGRRESVERDGTWNNDTVNCQLINPTRKTRHLNGVVEPCNDDRRHNVDDDVESETMTLQLFPLCSTKFCKYDSEREGRQDDQLEMMSDSDMIKSSTSPSCFQFFEFLPLKN